MVLDLSEFTVGGRARCNQEDERYVHGFDHLFLFPLKKLGQGNLNRSSIEQFRVLAIFKESTVEGI